MHIKSTTKSHVPVVISSVPWTDTDSLLMAPGVLKSCLTEIGIESRAIDLNQMLKQRMTNMPHRDTFLQFLLSEELSPEAVAAVKNQFEWMADTLLESGPDWICLSLLTYLSQISCRWLCFVLKKRRPWVKIVIGGPGCFSSLKGLDSFAITMKSRKLIDYFITGDGERSLQALLQGQTDYPGINSTSWKEISDLDSLPIPDYSDYDMGMYAVPSVSILGSRGCVRDCTFCDIHEHWEKFQWRSADSIFAEMLHQYQNYGISTFRFADSLINGNQKEYRKLIRLLAGFNRDRRDQDRIKWISYFIFRPQAQMPELDWQLTAESGAQLLMVGVESFVEHIRTHIKKKFNNDDLDYGLSMAKKYNIGLSLLIIVGYVTETEQDHLQQLEWIKTNRHYAGSPVKNVSMGSTMAVLPGTWVDRHRAELQIEMHSSDVHQDWTVAGISTPDQRMRWHRAMHDCLLENGYKPLLFQDNHVLIENYLKHGH